MTARHVRILQSFIAIQDFLDRRARALRANVMWRQYIEGFDRGPVDLDVLWARRCHARTLCLVEARA